jgi:ABC-type Na+ efflux pump permease subunit
MTFLPIVERELRVLSRLTGTYRKRVLAAGVVELAAMALLFTGSLVPTPSDVGIFMFHVLSWMLLLFCLFEGVRRTADCLSEERREGTLGLLFLTDLKGYDIVLGKLAATSLDSIYGLLAVLPMLGLSLLLGGILQGEFWRMALALANVLFFSLSAGVWVSARSRLERRAVAGTIWTVLLCLGAPFIAGDSLMARLSPFYPFLHAREAAYRASAGGYWWSLVVTQAVSWLLLGWASLAISRVQLDDVVVPNRSRLRREGSRGEARRAELRTKLLEINPALWLASRNARWHPVVWIFVVAAAVGSSLCIDAAEEGLVPLLVLFVALGFLSTIRVAAQAGHFLTEARRNSALEMLLCTPLRVEQIIRGQILALMSMFLLPIFLLVIIGLCAWIAELGLIQEREAWGMAILCTPFALIVFILNVIAVSWAGMWFGLTSKNGTQAAFKTILYVMGPSILPLLLLPFAFPLLILWPTICIVNAQEKVKRDFRRLVAERYKPPRTAQNSLVFWPEIS